MAQKAKKQAKKKPVKQTVKKTVATPAKKAVKKTAPKKSVKKSAPKKVAPKKESAQTSTPVQPAVRKGISPVHEAKKQKNYFMLALIVVVIVGLFALTIVKVDG